MSFIPVNLSCQGAAVRQLHMRDTLHFSPFSQPVLASEVREITNAVALGNRFDMGDFPNDFKFHPPSPSHASECSTPEQADEHSPTSLLNRRVQCPDADSDLLHHRRNPKQQRPGKYPEPPCRQHRLLVKSSLTPLISSLAPFAMLIAYQQPVVTTGPIIGMPPATSAAVYGTLQVVLRVPAALVPGPPSTIMPLAAL